MLDPLYIPSSTGGLQSRERLCDSPPPANGGLDCDGPRSENQICNDDPCRKYTSFASLTARRIANACLTAIPGVASSIPARSHTFVEIDHEIISTVILLPSADSFKKRCCQLQAKVCAQITGYPLVQACPGKSVVS